MKPVSFDYKRPATIDEACGLLVSDNNARILAGGQSLIPMLSMRLSRPSLLVDIAHIPELTAFVETKTHIEIGAMVRQAVNLPLEAQGIIIAVDRVLDMCRTSVNVWSDSCGCAIIAGLDSSTDASKES